jgi:hypothetical protein
LNGKVLSSGIDFFLTLSGLKEKHSPKILKQWYCKVWKNKGTLSGLKEKHNRHDIS